MKLNQGLAVGADTGATPDGLSPEELRDARAHPEKYENLQIRVCGWNVRWNDIPKEEQDEYILRAERIMR